MLIYYFFSDNKPALSITDQLADLKALLAKYPTVSPSAMGFPKGWKKEPLWQ